MIFIKQTFTFLLTLVLVLKISCLPISDYKEVIEYLQNFDYLTEDEKTSLNHIVDKDESVKNDNRFRRALKYLQVGDEMFQKYHEIHEIVFTNLIKNDRI